MALKDDVNSLIELYGTCDPEQILKCMGVAICNTDLLPPSTLAMKVTSDKEMTFSKFFKKSLKILGLNVPIYFYLIVKYLDITNQVSNDDFLFLII